MSTQTKASDVLSALLDLFRSGKRWAQGYYAYDKDHKHTGTFKPDAVCWCLVGGLAKVTPPLGGEPVRLTARRYLIEACPSGGIVDFNDKPGRTVQEVRELIRNARELALARGD